MTIRFLTSGESHGKCLNAIIEGVPAGLNIDKTFINNELKRRQVGFGRGGRMLIETDCVEIKSGVRHGKTIASPICLEIKNKDWENWLIAMNDEPQNLEDNEIAQIIASKKITKLRPGHADYAGAVKYNFDDIRNVLERSSARETATRVAVGAIAKLILKEFGITGFSHVLEIGQVRSDVTNLTYDEIREKAELSDLRCADDVAYENMKQEIIKAGELGTTLGGKIQVVFENLPVGLGSYVHWDKRLDGILAQALMSIPAIKAVEIGLGEQAGRLYGNKVHDEIYFENNKITRKTNNAGGLEGGMTNGEPLVLNLVMKPIPTMKTPLKSVDFVSKESIEAHFERADVCAVPACGVVAEAMCAIVLANALLDKFGQDNLVDIKDSFNLYKKRLEQM